MKAQHESDIQISFDHGTQAELVVLERRFILWKY